LQEHNRGHCPHTAKCKPWKIETAVAFASEAKARAFKKYLKIGSGRELLVAIFETHRGSEPTVRSVGRASARVKSEAQMREASIRAANPLDSTPSTV
jgi:hypothetical protein